MFENAFKYVDDVLRKDSGCSTELDYTEQSSWVLFLKYLDDMEADRAAAATLKGEKYAPLIAEGYRWRTWASPKGADGRIDQNHSKVGDDLLDFVNGELWPYLAGFKQSALSPDTLEYKIGEIFGEIKNKITSGYNLREIVERFDELRISRRETRAVGTL
jgi:type I restriction enzyme M protein